VTLFEGDFSPVRQKIIHMPLSCKAALIAHGFFKTNVAFDINATRKSPRD
jgi:hypothetical protein